MSIRSILFAMLALASTAMQAKLTKTVSMRKAQ